MSRQSYSARSSLKTAMLSIHRDGFPLHIQVRRTRPLEDHVNTMLAQVSLKLDKSASKFLVLEPREGNTSLLRGAHR